MRYETRMQALAHAKRESPKEACGLIYVHNGKEKYLECSNLAEVPTESFVLDPDDFEKAEDLGEIIEVIHSHPASSPLLSDLDKACMEWMKLPWSVVNPQTGVWSRGEPNGWKPPLVGRPYHWLVNDCWSVVRDWYKSHGVAVPTLIEERPSKLKDFMQADMFDELSIIAGFFEIENDTNSIQKGDLIFLTGEQNIVSHCAVYIGDSRILHHEIGRLSSIDIYDEGTQNATRKMLRHYNWKV